MSEKPTYEELKQRIRELELVESDRKRTEKALRESEEKYRQIFDNSTIGIGIADQEGRVIIFNDAILQPGNYSKDDIRKLDSIGELYYNPDDRNKVLSIARDQGFVNEMHIKFKRKDGTPYDTLFSLRPIAVEGKPCWQAIVSDITERKQAVEALRKSREKYQELAESISDVFFAMDKNLRCTYWNKASEKLTGIPARKAIGKTFMEVFQENEVLEKVKNMYLQVIETKKPEQLIVQYPSNEQIVHEINAYPTLEGVTVFVKDITERKRLEEELLRVQKLESVGLLAGGIAHDFNNILTMILGNVSLAKMQVASENEIFEMLSEAETASLKAQALTKQLLTFAKGGAPVKETTSIKDFLKESSSFLLRGSNSTCKFSIAEDLWPAEFDAGQMSQVINNIVINANQAMPEGGTIQVTADNLKIEIRHNLPVKPGRYIKISIVDQGGGIADKHLSKIFDPYFTTKQKGNGLGLAMAYSIIKKHEGHITVESQLGVSTTFHIYLPASEKTVSEKEEAKLVKGQGRILVMDDEASLRNLIERMLENLGYESEVAADGAEAIQMYKEAQESEKPYVAVILDLTVPGKMGGKECVTKLLDIDPEVKAIVSSGYSDDPVMSNFQEFGFKGMMPKPFESLSLSKVLHEVLNNDGVKS